MHRVGGRDVGYCGNDDFIARLQPETNQRKMKGCCSIVCCDGMFDAAETGEAPLKLLNIFAIGRNPVCIDTIEHILLFSGG